MRTAKWLLAMVAFSWAITGDEVAKKYGMQNPEFSLENLDFSSLTRTTDSSVYFYRDTTDVLDSIHQLYDFLSPEPSLRKTTFKYVNTKIGRLEMEVKTNMKTGEMIYDETRTYDEAGRLLAVDLKSQSMIRHTTGYKYDDRGNRIEKVELNYAGENSGHYTYQYDKKNRLDKWRNEDFKDGRYRNLLYTSFDSVSAAVDYFPAENRQELRYIKMFNADKKECKYIEYFGMEEQYPSIVAYSEYDGQKRLTDVYKFQWVDKLKPWRHEEMEFVWHESYEYDDRGRLKRKIIHEKPLED